MSELRRRLHAMIGVEIAKRKQSRKTNTTFLLIGGPSGPSHQARRTRKTSTAALFRCRRLLYVLTMHSHRHSILKRVPQSVEVHVLAFLILLANERRQKTKMK
jgi:hypothetical protein